MEIKTKRLVIKPFTKDDEAELLTLITNETIKKTYMIPDLKTIEDRQSMLEKLIRKAQSEDRLELGVYMNNKLIGFFNDVGIEESTIELGYAIHPDHHGKGYATEALKAVTHELFNCGYKEVITGAFEENTASIRVMQKCGMELISKTEEIEYHHTKHHCIFYSVKNN